MTPQERAADAATGIAWGGVVTSFAADALPVVQLIAVCVAIVASGFAIAYYVQRISRND